MAPSLTRVVETHAPEETVQLGERLGALLRPGDFLGLVGELGAGKTQLVRGIAAGAGVDSHEVASPTFAIVYPYKARGFTLFHADLYRVTDMDELYGTGFLDLVGGDGALMVEWINQLWQAAPPERLVIRLEAPSLDAENLRRLTVEATGSRPVALLTAWLGPQSSSGEG